MRAFARAGAAELCAARAASAGPRRDAPARAAALDRGRSRCVRPGRGWLRARDVAARAQRHTRGDRPRRDGDRRCAEGLILRRPPERVADARNRAYGGRLEGWRHTLSVWPWFETPCFARLLTMRPCRLIRPTRSALP